MDPATPGSKGKYPGLSLVPPDFVKDYPPLALVHEEKCIACDRCPPLCFFDALFMEDRPNHPFKRVAVVVPDNCTGCGLCFEACPVDAIVWVPDMSNGKGVRPKPGQLQADTDV